MTDIQKLRASTGIGMMACKKALAEADGDAEKAVEILRKRGEIKAAEKSDRSTNEGVIAISGKAILKILCETDFVARNEKFIKFADEIVKIADSNGENAARDFFEKNKTDKIQEIGENLVLDEIKILQNGKIFGEYVHSNRKIGAIVALDSGEENAARDVAMHVVAMNPAVAHPSDVPQNEIEKEKEIYREQLQNEGKPAQIIDKIIDGKVKKFCAERALASQNFVKDPSTTVEKFLNGAKIVDFLRMEI